MRQVAQIKAKNRSSMTHWAEILPRFPASPARRNFAPEKEKIMSALAAPKAPAQRATRSTYSLPPRQQETLDRLSTSTGLTKNELIRQAIGLLTIAVTARERGLVLALANDEDKVLSHIISSI
jgi:hypothetical protein